MELTGSCRERVEASQRPTSRVSSLRTVKLFKSSRASVVLKWKSSLPVPFVAGRLLAQATCVLSLHERTGTLSSSEVEIASQPDKRQGEEMLEYVPDVFCTTRMLSRLPTLSSFFPVQLKWNRERPTNPKKDGQAARSKQLHGKVRGKAAATLAQQLGFCVQKQGRQTLPSFSAS